MKKTVIILLALCMVLAVAGCTPGVTPTAEATATPAPSDGASIQPTAEPVYMKAGDVYRVLIWDTAVENAPINGDTPASQKLRERVNDICDGYGVTITYVASTGWNWQEDAKAASEGGEPICELMHAGQPGALPSLYAYNGNRGTVVTNITALGLDDLFADNEFWNVGMQEAAGRYNGSLYFVMPQATGFDSVGLNQVTIFNTGLLQNFGYTKEQLYELCNNGEWTFEKLRSVALDATDPDREIYGMCLGQASCAMCSMVAGNGGNFITKIDGIDRFTANDDKVIYAIDFLADMAGIDKSVLLTPYTDDEVNGFVAGKYSIMLTYANRLPKIAEAASGIECGVLLPPKGPDADDYISEVNWYEAWCVMGNISNPAGAVQCLSKLICPEYGINSPENTQLLEADASLYVHDTESISNLKKAIEKSKATTYQTYCWLTSNVTGFGFGNAILYCFNDFVSGTKTPEVYYQSVVDAANELINNYFAVKN